LEQSKLTCLISACSYGRITVVTALLQKRANPNLTTYEDETALHYAAYKGFTAIAKLLVQAGVDLHVKDIEGRTSLDNAVEEKQKECGEYLRSVGAVCNKEKYPSDWAISLPVITERDNEQCPLD